MFRDFLSHKFFATHFNVSLKDICMHIYIYKYIHLYIYKHTHTYTHTFLYVRVCVYIYIYIPGHFVYFDKRSFSLNVIWQPVRRPYCASVNSHSPMGLVSRQWDAVDWVSVLCDCRCYNDRASRSASSLQCACPFYSSRAGFFVAKHHITQVCQPPHSPHFFPCDFWLFPKLKSPLKWRRFVNVTVTQYTSPVNDVSLPTD